MAACKAKKMSKKHPPAYLPEHMILTDVKKRNWQLGKSIGSGGFGAIYLGSRIESDNATLRSEFDYVIKVENHENGPLFTELHCYNSIGKAEKIEEWRKKRHLKYVGLSPSYGSGSLEYNGMKYRFLVMNRYGPDLQKQLNHVGVLCLKTAYTVALNVLNTLEYIHSCGYLHADIKAANLLLGRRKECANQVYLVDMGLAVKFLYNEGNHKKDAPDKKRIDAGTMEFISRDVHRGSPWTRRSDLETLGYNVLKWLSSKLPWDNVKNPRQVETLKCRYMENLPDLLNFCFTKGIPDGIAKYLIYVKNLEYEAVPNYEHCRTLFVAGIHNAGLKVDDILTFKKQEALEAGGPYREAGKSSEKENKKAKSGKKKAATPIVLDSGIIPTPAMLEVLKKRM